MIILSKDDLDCRRLAWGLSHLVSGNKKFLMHLTWMTRRHFLCHVSNVFSTVVVNGEAVNK